MPSAQQRLGLPAGPGPGAARPQFPLGWGTGREQHSPQQPAPPDHRAGQGSAGAQPGVPRVKGHSQPLPGGVREGWPGLFLVLTGPPTHE